MEDNSNAPETYEFKLKILNNEIINVVLSTNNLTNKRAAISTVVVIALVTLIGAYGKHLVDLYNYIIK